MAASIYLQYLGTRYIVVHYAENTASVVRLFRFAINLRYLQRFIILLLQTVTPSR
jgi:hypothetical protein